MTPSIHVQIESLVLEGLPISPAQRPLFQAALEKELGRLLAEEDERGLTPLLHGGGAVYSLPAPDLQVERNSSPAQLGIQTARSIYGGLSR